MALESDAKLKAKLTCAFKNDMRNFGKFSPEHLIVSKLESRKCMSLKFTGE